MMDNSINSIATSNTTLGTMLRDVRKEVIGM